MLKRFLYLILFTGLILSSCGKEVSVSPPDEPPPDGKVYINSTPENALIFLNGKDRRRYTPDSLTWLKTDNYFVTLKKPYFLDTTFEITAVEGEKINYSINYLEDPRMLGSLSCTSKPLGADIFYEDSITGRKTPYKFSGLVPGVHKIKYKLENHESVSSEVIIESSKNTELALTLLDTTIWNYYKTTNSDISSDRLTCIEVNHNDILWIGSSGNGVIIFDTKGKAFTSMRVSNSNLPHDYINDIEIVPELSNTIWIGTRSGLLQLNPELVYNFRTTPLTSLYINAVKLRNRDELFIGTKKELGKVYLSEDFFWELWDSTNSPLYSSNVTTISFGFNSIWIGTAFGIGRLLSGEWKVYSSSENNFPSNLISASDRDKEGYVWFAHQPGIARGGGLSYFNGSEFIPFYSELLNDKVNSIYVDSKNNKWIATSTKLMKILPDNINFEVFNVETTGLDFSNSTDVVEDSKGNIWITTAEHGLIKYKGQKNN